jgi:ABC-type amino acid transport substrate-binding protein
VRRIATVLMVLGVLVLAGTAAATAADPPLAPDVAPPPRPAALVVAVSLGDPALQAGVVRGRDVILARGFEIALARALVRRLGSRIDRFLDVRQPGRLLAVPAAPSWHIAIASLQASRAPGAVELSTPYLTTDLAIVLRRGHARPRRLAGLRTALLCVARGDGALPVVARTIRPTRAPLVAAGRERLRALIRTGACDAAVLPAHATGRFVAGQRRLLGPVAGRIAQGDGLVVAVARGSGIALADVNRVLASLRADGTLGRLARMWLGLDPALLRRLR